MTVDDTYSIINDAFKMSEFKDFSESSARFKIVHRCLDGIGVNYTEDKILSVKAYCKILDSAPKFSNDFLNTFCKEEAFRRVFFDLSNKGSSCILDRNTGLAGVNIGLKYNIDKKSFTKTVYLKTNPKISEVINYSNGEISNQKYHYLFNPLLKNIVNLWFRFGIPKSSHALEFSKRKEGAFATVYPVFKRRKNERPSSMREKYGNLFLDLNKKDEWEIEKNILKAVKENFPLWTPITKGYEEGGTSRKIYMGTFSYKHSSFKYF